MNSPDEKTRSFKPESDEQTRPDGDTVPEAKGDAATVDGGDSVGETSSSANRSAFDQKVPDVVGQYRLLGKLGEGGMGAVYRAEHLSLKRVVALKVLANDRMRTDAAEVRFQREMAAAGQLLHPNIVASHDAGEDQGVYFLAMELIEGPTVDSVLRSGPLTIANACDIIRQTALGLDHAHQLGLVHRDIKPSNLMLLPVGEGKPLVKILDFGLARHEVLDDDHELTAKGQLMGTVDYVAPEQADGGDIGPWSDIYSLGATLYKLITGVAPYADAGRTLLEKLAAMARGPAPSIRTRADLPTGLADLIDSMMSPEPTERPKSALLVADALTPFIADSNLSARIRQQQAAVPDDDAPTETLGDSASERGQMRVSRAQADAERSDALRHSIDTNRSHWILVGGILLVLIGLLVGWKVMNDTSRTVEPSDTSSDGETQIAKRPGPVDNQVAKDGETGVSGTEEAEPSRGQMPLVNAVPRSLNRVAPMTRAGDDVSYMRWTPTRSQAPSPKPNYSARSFPIRNGFAQPKAVARPTDAQPDRDLTGAANATNAANAENAAPVAPIATEQKLAAYVLSRGGAVQLQVADKQWICDQPQLLPKTKFNVVGVHTLEFVKLDKDGLQLIDKAGQLATLRAPKSAMTDEELKVVAKNSRLRELDISRTAVTNQGLAVLQSVPLRYIGLRDTRVDDGCIDVLAAMKTLKQIELQGSGVTEAGKAALRDQLPEAEVK